jgi:hypothetical protein
MLAELFCGLSAGALSPPPASEQGTLAQARVQALLAIATTLPPRWSRYDLDLMGNWRPFSVERACIDALTQRTAMLRIEAEGGGALAMLAMGKRGEPPSLLVRFAADSDAPCLAAKAQLLAAMQSGPLGDTLERCGVSPSEPRGAFFTQAKGLTTVGGVDLGCWWMGLRKTRLSAPIERLQAAGVVCEPVGDFWSLDLLPSPTLPSAQAVARWLSIGERLAKP